MLGDLQKIWIMQSCFHCDLYDGSYYTDTKFISQPKWKLTAGLKLLGQSQRLVNYFVTANFGTFCFQARLPGVVQQPLYYF